MHLNLQLFPLLPIAFALIIGIIVGRYVTIEAWIILLILFVLTLAAIGLFRFPRIQTSLIWFNTAVIGFYLIQHPLPDVPIVQLAKQNMLEYRQLLLDKYKNNMSDKAYEVVAVMTLGEKTVLTRETRETFNTTGAAHILAISGLHLGIIYMLVTLLIRGRRWRMTSQILTLLLLWAFAFLVGMTPSVVRAATMLTVYGLLSLGYRQKMSLNVLAFTAILLLVIHPDDLFNIGFQMSFLAVLSILLFYPPFNSLLSQRWLIEHRLTSFLWGMCIVSLAAQIGVAPLIAFYFHRFSTCFLLANFVVIPCAYLILIGGMLLLLTSWSIVGAALTMVVSFMNTSLSTISALPYSSIDGLHPNLPQILLIYLLIGCFWVILQKLRPIK